MMAPVERLEAEHLALLFMVGYFSANYDMTVTENVKEAEQKMEWVIWVDVIYTSHKRVVLLISEEVKMIIQCLAFV